LNNLTELWSFILALFNPVLTWQHKTFWAKTILHCHLKNANEDPLAARKASQGLKGLDSNLLFRT